MKFRLSINKSILCNISILLLASVLLNACNALKSEAVFQKQSAQAVRYGEHTVAKGDTLYSIAWRFKRNYKELAKLNAIPEPYVIKIGQVIILGPAIDEIPSKMGYTGQGVVAQSSSQKSRSNYVEKNVPENTGNTAPKAKKTWLGLGSAIENNQNKIIPLQWQWPAKGPVIQNFSGSAVGKKGIQIAGNAGDPVKAAAGGQVVYSGNGLVGYGNLVIVKHNEDFLTAYAHNQKVLVKEGDQVLQGQQIAEMGSSGTDRNKLHFEIRYEGSPVNPANYLPKR